MQYPCICSPSCKICFRKPWEPTNICCCMCHSQPDDELPILAGRTCYISSEQPFASPVLAPQQPPSKPTHTSGQPGTYPHQGLLDHRLLPHELLPSMHVVLPDNYLNNHHATRLPSLPQVQFELLQARPLIWSYAYQTNPHWMHKPLWIDEAYILYTIPLRYSTILCCNMLGRPQLQICL